VSVSVTNGNIVAIDLLLALCIYVPMCAICLCAYVLTSRVYVHHDQSE